MTEYTYSLVLFHFGVFIQNTGQIADRALFESSSFGNDWAIPGLLLPGHCFFGILYEPVSVLGVLDSLLSKFIA